MEQESTAFTLQLGKERLCFSRISKLQQMRHSWNEPRHSNGDWELHLILEGTCSVELEDRACTLTTGQALLIAPGQYHMSKSLPGEFQRLSLSFVPDTPILAQQLQEKCPDSLRLEPNAALLTPAKLLLEEQVSCRAFYRTSVEAFLSLLAVELLRILEIRETEKTEQKPLSSHIKGTIDAYFEGHFADSAGEQVLAQQLHISRRQLVRILQEHYGMSFRQKLIHTRMDYAAWLLRTTDRQVSDIAETVGYSSEAAFFKLFRKQFGMPPASYRNCRKKECRENVQ